MTNDAYLIGSVGERHIRDELSQRDPLQVIQQMQRDHGLKLPGVHAIYPLLDHHGRLRREVHAACLEGLKKELIKNIDVDKDLGDLFSDKFNRLLQETLPYITIPQLQEIPMALMRRCPNRPSEEVLEQLKQDPDIFKACPIEIRRRVWKADESLFTSEIFNLITIYHNDEELQRLEMDMRPLNVVELVKSRRDHPILLEILNIIGDDVQLYDMFINVVKLVFDGSPHPSLATIRFDILMALHETEVKKIYDTDPTHMLVWSLDACVRNQTLDDFRITKIRECFDGLKREMPLYVDFAMVLMDPTTANLFSNFILRLVRASIEGDNQDMDTDTIEWAGRMINLGANAHRIHVTRQYKAPKLERALREEFWSTMAGFVVDEQADVAGTVDLNRDMEDAEIRIVEDLCKRSEVARKVFLQYTLERALIPDIPSLTRCLPRILNTLPPAVNPDENVDGDQVLHSFTYHSFLHSFLAVLARSHLPRLINTPRFQKVVLHDFLFPLLERWDESAHEIVARFWSEFFDVRVIGGQVGGIQHAGIGEGVRIVAEWADKAFELGKKDDDRIYTLYHLYETLIKRSCNSYLPKKGPEKPEDEDLERNRQPYAISPPAIMEFLAQGIPGQYGIVLGSGLQNPPLGDDAMEEEMGEQEDVVMTS